MQWVRADPVILDKLGCLSFARAYLGRTVRLPRPLIRELQAYLRTV